MNWARESMIVLTVSASAAGGCGGLCWLGDVLGALCDSEQCVIPLEPQDLNDVFGHAVAVQWVGESVELTDDAQPEVATYYEEHLAGEVLPRYFLNERFFALGAMAAGDMLELELLSDVISDAWLYDADYVMSGGATHDFDGRRREIIFPIRQDTPACFLRINFYYLSDTDSPVARVTRTHGQETAVPAPQAVVLNLSGHEDVRVRSGNIHTTSIAPLGDPVAAEKAVEVFKETFAAFDLTVLTGQDPVPTTPFSIIHVGPATPPLDATGTAELLDYGNIIRDDIAIVDTSSLFLRGDALGVVLGKAAAHEMGHLLGLHHVVHPDALMADTLCAQNIPDLMHLREAGFMKAPIRAGLSDFTMGYQDAEKYVLEVLGPARND